MADKALRERMEELCVSVGTVLQDAGVEDRELLTLTREDLQELFPGVQNFQLRRKILGMLSEEAREPPRPSASTLANALKDFIQRNGENMNRNKELWCCDIGDPAVEGVLRAYLGALRDLEKQLTAALDFLKPHIELLENLSHVPSREEPTDSGNTLSCRLSGSKGHAARTPVKIHSLVCGNTLGAHKSILTLMQPVEESSLKDCRVILLFCPITTRAGTDIDAAIQKLPSIKETILVVMHYTCDQDHIGVDPRIISPDANIVQQVNVMFHDSVPGLLLTCQANDQAIAKLQATLQQFK